MSRIWAIGHVCLVLLAHILFSAGPVQSAALADPSTLVKLSVEGAPVSVAAGEPAELLIKADISEGWHVNAHTPAQDYLVPTVLTLTATEDISVENIQYPDPVQKTFSFSETSLDLYEGSVIFRIQLKIAAEAEGERKIAAILLYQACDDEKCLPPAEVRLDIPLAVTPETAAAEEKEESVDAAPAGVRYERLSGGTADGKIVVAELFHSQGIFLSLLAIFWAGVLLNLTPCVYPMIPITVAYFAGHKSSGSQVKNAISYFLGIVITYSLLGTAAGLTGGLFGAVLQNSAVLIFLACLMLYMAAGMFGWVSFGMPDSVLQKIGTGKVPFGSFGLGATMGLVAAPCIGPFVVGLLAYVGARQSPLLGFALFSVMAAGLGLPYLILGLFSGQIPNLPKSGSWMDAVKCAFGFILAAMAVFFIAPLISDSAESKLYGAVLAAAALSAVFAGVRKGKFAAIAGIILAALLIVPAVRMAFPPPGLEAADEFWLPYDSVSMDSARASGRPVLLDFYAEWCLPCKKMDRVTYSDARVRDALDHVVRLKVDLTLYDTPESVEVRRAFNISGVPTTLYVDAAGRERLRYEGFVSPDLLLKDLAELKTP